MYWTKRFWISTSLYVGIAMRRPTPDGWWWYVFLQLQKHDREEEDMPSKWRTEEEMAAEASDLSNQLH